MIDRHRVEPLRATLAGEVILPADAGYEEGRKIFNAMHDKRPAVIARCRSTADVVAAVDFARKYGLLVAVRSGGHSVAGLSICADGILIDLSGLKRIEVDASARTARAGGGVLWGDSTPPPSSTDSTHRAAASRPPASAGSPPAAATAGRPRSTA